MDITKRSGIWAVCSAGALTLTLLPGVAGAAGGSALTAAGVPPAQRFEATAEAPVYRVVKEGLTAEDAKALGARAEIPVALRKDGSFSYVDVKRSGVVPSTKGKVTKDENGRRTVAQKLDLKTLRSLRVLSDGAALERARGLLPVPDGFQASPRVDHTTVDLANKRGRYTESHLLDTQVSYDLSLNKTPVVGPGARSSVSFDARGGVLSLTQSVREVELDRHVGIMSAQAAQQECSRVYGARTRLAPPTLVYYAPPLTGQGEGSIAYLVPQYSCIPAVLAEDGAQPTGLLIPASPELAPTVDVVATREGKRVSAELGIEGGQKPYAIQWSSANRTSIAKRGSSIAYKIDPRRGKVAETLTATVTDANGIVSSVSVRLGKKGGEASATGFGGGGGALASYGISSPIDEWSCAQNSSNGFRNVMNAKGHTKSFDWRGDNAWESDFKRTSNGGHDDQYADKVDIAYYTGHGSPNSFTFENTTQDDGSITPNDARWGDNYNLEWMNLESCQVLRNVDGNHDYFQRWASAFDGLHVLNGFDTNAQCNSSTGGRFAEYLFPRTFLFWTSPAMSVTQAWAQTARDLQPGGRRWRSVSPIGANGVHNLNDRFWGQGSVGPDIRAHQRTGFIAISGTT